MPSTMLKSICPLLFIALIHFATGQKVSNDECQKNIFFASAHQLQKMASALFVQFDSQKENEFLGKAFATLCCLMSMKSEADFLKKDDELAMGGEVKAKLSNFCQKMKNGESIGKAAKSEAGKAIAEAAESNLEMNPQIYEGLRKMEKFKILSPENRLEIGTFVTHCIHLLNVYRTLSKVGVFCVGPHLRPITRRRKKRANDIEKTISYSVFSVIAFIFGYVFFIAHNKVDSAKNGLSSFVDKLPDFTHGLAHNLTDGGISDELAKMEKYAMIAAIVCFVLGAFSIVRIIILCCCSRRN